MDMKKLLSIVDNSGTKEKTVITEGTNMAQQMVMQQYSKPQQTAPKFKSRINEYFKVVDNEMLNVLKEEQEQKKIEVKKIVNRVLTRMDEGKTDKATAPKPRNFVAKNATTSGAGAHKDKKKADKQGDVKHKSKALELAELRTEVKDKDGKVTSWKDEGEWTKVEKNKAGKDKDSRGRVTNLSDKARRETEKQNKELAEKAVSKSQQKLMGMVHAAKKGEKAASPAVAKIAKGMSKGDAEDFASTKHKGLPEKKAKQAVKESYGSVEVGAPVKVYSNVLKKAVFGKVVKLREGRAYVQYDNTKIIMGHPIETVQLKEAATVPAPAPGMLKGAGKMAARFLPGLGAVAGAYDAYDRFKKGDYTGAALSAGAGLSSFVPVVGTAAAMGLTAAQLGRDKARTGSFLPGEEEQLAAVAKDQKAAASGQAATPAPGAMTPNPKTPAAAAAKPQGNLGVKQMQKELGVAADGIIGDKTKAAIAKNPTLAAKYGFGPDGTALPQQAATPGPGDKIASAVRTALPVAGAAARQALTK